MGREVPHNYTVAGSYIISCQHGNYRQPRRGCNTLRSNTEEVRDKSHCRGKRAKPSQRGSWMGMQRRHDSSARSQNTKGISVKGCLARARRSVSLARALLSGWACEYGFRRRPTNSLSQPNGKFGLHPKSVPQRNGGSGSIRALLSSWACDYPVHTRPINSLCQRAERKVGGISGDVSFAVMNGAILRSETVITTPPSLRGMSVMNSRLA